MRTETQWLLSKNSGEYRYWLRRDLPRSLTHDPAETQRVGFVMLNPSTATDDTNDATVRKLVGFALRWGCTEIHVANLYCRRATDPAELWQADIDPVGDYADDALDEMIWLCGDAPHRLVVAWGSNARPARIVRFLELVDDWGVELWALDVNADGQPRHPLYVPYAQGLSLWRPRREPGADTPSDLPARSTTHVSVSEVAA